uniref:Lysophosphatidic acid receptor 5 n=1 Tax=Geotrypetes seraphini TaxID=260995 RepID=A0A6P8P7J6_GEOSA|nr:lysophosphatidic acid receptor 5 [Geotrypetes seraphini]XP_033779675.1 lysophosphatidic acid receptor 5 [Geotrypetes seraphini]XP_033779676.1 lysophosphatidic acid receptor 5 [Geotrypetes seraphini]XP_033779677.1 lysophosphatidic acid receptor 5 [Geotrypetes seraphini]XP_033779678.1 lysophosphatidic acid receptor 5 [Geotrypetes seraphini]XP_033779679.1 lysophosphatidic acid receptor 5 [Geotrypetes seraphini]XP_033779680.1 lysophosphatidic acid receptor 5 [Geotrypetes seraphini]XP_03377968
MADPNTSQNLSKCEDYRSNHTLHLAGYSILFPLGLFLNILALWIFLRYLHLRSVVSIYMFNLALSDLLFTLSLPLRLYYYSHHNWPFGKVLCQVNGSLFQINMYGSCIFLMCINLDRYVAIVHPLRWRHLRRPKVARLVCLGVWALILMGSVPAALIHVSNDCRYKDRKISRCFEAFSAWERSLFPLIILVEVLGFLLPLLFVVYGSARIFWELCRGGGSYSDGSKQVGGRRQKTVRLLVVNLIIFIICFVPYNLTLATYGLLRAHVIEAGKGTVGAVRQALVVTILLASMNCTLDPLVYYFSTEGFRNTFKGLRQGQTWNCEPKVLNTVLGKGKTENGAHRDQRLPSTSITLLNRQIQDSAV